MTKICGDCWYKKYIEDLYEDEVIYCNHHEVMEVVRDYENNFVLDICDYWEEQKNG